MKNDMQNEIAVEETVIEESEVQKSQIELKVKELQLLEKSEFLQFRKQWSTYLLSLVVFIVVFNAIFLIAIGFNWLSFDDEWLVRLIFAGSFVEVLGLAKIVVDFLFKSPPES